MHLANKELHKYGTVRYGRYTIFQAYRRTSSRGRAMMTCTILSARYGFTVRYTIRYSARYGFTVRYTYGMQYGMQHGMGSRYSIQHGIQSTVYTALVSMNSCCGNHPDLFFFSPTAGHTKRQDNRLLPLARCNSLLYLE